MLRYGTMSSLEKVSSEDADDKTLNSSDEEYDCDDGKLGYPSFLADDLEIFFFKKKFCLSISQQT